MPIIFTENKTHRNFRYNRYCIHVVLVHLPGERVLPKISRYRTADFGEYRKYYTAENFCFYSMSIDCFEVFLFQKNTFVGHSNSLKSEKNSGGHTHSHLEKSCQKVKKFFVSGGTTLTKECQKCRSVSQRCSTKRSSHSTLSNIKRVGTCCAGWFRHTISVCGRQAANERSV